MGTLTAFLTFRAPDGDAVEMYGPKVTEETESWWVVLCSCNRLIVRYDTIEEMEAICKIADEIGLKYLNCFNSLSEALG